jgi:hypothetical protein
MKLKAITASLLALGLSAPVMAMQPYMLDTTYQLDVMRDQLNRLDLILDQNQPGGFDQACGWTCRINVSGWINTDAYLANRPPVFLTFDPTYNTGGLVAPGNLILIPTEGRASDLLLNNANLLVDARVNNWVTANLSLIYTSLTAVPGTQGFYGIADSLFVYHPIPSGNVVTRSIDTAYATIGNFQVSPVYFRVGKEYVPFGQYDPYAFVQSENPTQLISEINAPTAQLGFIIPNGFYGSVYTFAGNPKRSDAGSTRRIQNGGVDLGFGWKIWNSKINVDAGWLANIADSNFLSSYYLNSLIEGTAVTGLPNKKTPAWNVNADLTFGPFDANGHYISTTRNLANPVFLSGSTPSSPFVGQVVIPVTLGKPNVWGLEAGLTFPVVAHQSRLALGWQQTTHLATFLPKKRFYIDYLVNFAKWFDLGLAVGQDRDYSLGEGAIFDNGNNLVHLGATDNKSTFGQLRASIKFA